MAKKKKSQKKSAPDLLKDTFHGYIKDSLNFRYNQGYSKEAIDLDNVRVKRRLQALKNTIEPIMKKAVAVLPEIEPQIISINWSQANTMIPHTYDNVDDMFFITLGAGIWILDVLRKENLLSDVIPYLPKVNDADDIHCPALYDPSHSTSLHMAMMLAIQQRNKDCTRKGKQSATTNQSNQIPRTLIDLYTAEGTQHQDVPSRNLFEWIMDMIPEEAKEAALKAFEDKFYEWIDRYFRCRKNTLLQEQEIAERVKALHNGNLSVSLDCQMIDLVPYGSAASNLPFSIPKELLPNGKVNLLNNPEIRKILEADVKRQLREVDDEVFRINSHHFWLIASTYEETVDYFGKDIVDIWADFCIEDPYEMCFAFLYLLDSGSDLPWLYFPGTNLMKWVAYSLPWARLYNEEAQTLYNYTPVSKKELESESSCGVKAQWKEPLTDKWYRMNYETKDIDTGYTSKISLAQIIYELTGGIMPRKTDSFLPALQLIKDTGVSLNEDPNALLCCLSLLWEGNLQSRDYCGTNHTEETLQANDEPDTSDYSDVRAELEQRIVALQKETDILRQALYAANSEVKKLQKELETDTQKFAAERQELIDLRELVFNQHNETYELEADTASATFPYITEKNIVVFGGHDSWTREIKQKLPNVRFIERTMKPNTLLIRNADMVWIQTNALSHAFYYTIIDEVRRYNIPLRYFSYASATKCAEQLVAAASLSK